jgi:hypothetical protein
VNQQSRQNLGPRLYSEGDLGNRESKREMLRSAIGGTARFEREEDWMPDTAELRRVLEGNPRILRIAGMDFWRVEIDWLPACML